MPRIRAHLLNCTFCTLAIVAIATWLFLARFSPPHKFGGFHLEVVMKLVHIIVAMQAEALVVVKKLKLKKIFKHKLRNVDIYRGKFDEKIVHLFVNKKDDGMDKIGTVQAALLTYKAIQFKKPNLILNVGTCGGIHAKGLKIFDIICAKDFVIYHDRFGGDDEKSVRQSLRFLPVDSADCPLDDSIVVSSRGRALLSSRGLTAGSTLKYGIIASSNSLLIAPKSWENIHKYNVLCVDMEAAAVAEVAHEFSIPFMAYKVVTDYVYEIHPIDTLSQFVENFQGAMEVLSEFLFQVLESKLNF